MLSAVMWAWTEQHGKYLGCPYLTKLAIGVYKRDRSTDGLRHEHVVPKKCLMSMLFNLPNPTPQHVIEILSRYLIGVIVTREEDAILGVEYSKLMPAEFENCPDVTARDKLPTIAPAVIASHQMDRDGRAVFDGQLVIHRMRDARRSMAAIQEEQEPDCSPPSHQFSSPWNQWSVRHRRRPERAR